MVGHGRAGIGRDAVDHRKAGHGRVDGAGHEPHEIAMREPGAESAGVLRRGRAGEDAQVDGFDPALFPVHAAQILRKAFGKPVEGVGAVGDIGVDALAHGIHADGMDRGGIDDTADAVARGRLPHVVGADEVGAPEILEGSFVDDGAEVDDHVGAFEKGGDLLHPGEVGAVPGFVGVKIVGGGEDVGGDEVVAELGEGGTQDGAERAAGTGEDEFPEHGRTFRCWRPGGAAPAGRGRGEGIRSRHVREGVCPAGCGPCRGGRGRAR